MNASPHHRSLLRRLCSEALSLAFPALVIFAVKSSAAEINFVPSGSMEPTILVGDAVWVNHLAYGLRVPFSTIPLGHWGDPARGDIVVCYEPGTGTRLVKRVVGLPGDTIELRQDILYVNGAALSYSQAARNALAALSERERSAAIVAQESLGAHPHVVMALPALPAMRSFGPVHVPAGSYFIMGDNRDNSEDSRYFGPVARNQIVGRVSTVVVSFDPQAYLRPRLDRLFAALP